MSEPFEDSLNRYKPFRNIDVADAAGAGAARDGGGAIAFLVALFKTCSNHPLRALREMIVLIRFHHEKAVIL